MKKTYNYVVLFFIFNCISFYSTLYSIGAYLDYSRHAYLGVAALVRYTSAQITECAVHAYQGTVSLVDAASSGAITRYTQAQETQEQLETKKKKLSVLCTHFKTFKKEIGDMRRNIRRINKIQSDAEVLYHRKLEAASKEAGKEVEIATDILSDLKLTPAILKKIRNLRGNVRTNLKAAHRFLSRTRKNNVRFTQRYTAHQQSTIDDSTFSSIATHVNELRRNWTNYDATTNSEIFENIWGEFTLLQPHLAAAELNLVYAHNGLHKQEQRNLHSSYLYYGYKRISALGARIVTYFSSSTR